MDVGAVQVRVTEVFPDVAVPMVGAPGTVVVVGVTVLEAAENGLSPRALLASTWNRYWDPFVRPVTTRLVVPAAAVRRAPAAGCRPLQRGPLFDSMAARVRLRRETSRAA